MLAAIACASAGCAPTVKLSPHQASLQSSQACVRAEYGRMHQSLHEVIGMPVTEPVAPGASPELVRILRAAGMSLPSQGDYRNLTATLIHLQLLKSEISAASAYIDCLGHAVEEIQRAMVDRRGQDELLLALASIGVSAVAGVAAGAVDLAGGSPSAAPALGIGGGVGAAGLGLAALAVPSPTIEVSHPVNVVRAVWMDEPTGGLPPFVWRLLEMPRMAEASPRDALKQQWQGMLASLDPKRRDAVRDLLLGSGGAYDLATLDLREALLDQLETEVELMNQDFQALVEYIAMRFVQPAPAR